MSTSVASSLLTRTLLRSKPCTAVPFRFLPRISRRGGAPPRYNAKSPPSPTLSLMLFPPLDAKPNHPTFCPTSSKSFLRQQLQPTRLTVVIPPTVRPFHASSSIMTHVYFNVTYQEGNKSTGYKGWSSFPVLPSAALLAAPHLSSCY